MGLSYCGCRLRFWVEFENPDPSLYSCLTLRIIRLLCLLGDSHQ